MLVWCIFLLDKICYSRMIKIGKYFVILEIEGDVVEKRPFLKVKGDGISPYLEIVIIELL